MILKTFFISSNFKSKARLKLPKKDQANATQHLEAGLENYLKTIHVLHSPCHSKIIGHILKNKQKNKCVYIHKIIRLTIIRMKMKMKNRSHRHDINRPRLKRRHWNSKYRKCLRIMMLICIKQHISNICSSIHENVMQHWGWVELHAVQYMAYEGIIPFSYGNVKTCF